MKKLTNIGNFSTINQFVDDKIARYEKAEKTFSTLYQFNFENKDNVFAEWSNGYKIEKITYGECDKQIRLKANSFNSALSFLEKGETVGLYMENSLGWIQTFWCILMCGYNPLLLNSKLPKSVLENLLSSHNVKCVISDGETFPVKTLNAFDLLNQEQLEEFNPSVWGKEIYFMTSGTTGNAKLCAYNPTNVFYQICDSGNTITRCPQLKEHYQGELKLLTLLPFYHIFGFIAVYMWFTFMARTLVFLKDLRPQTLLGTVKRHKVTHVFAVPLVWNSIYSEAIKKIKARGKKTFNKAQKGLKLANSYGAIGKFISKKAFKEVRENIFGDSIKFCINGGGAISKEVISFFNGIGYHLANGYGMTEIGVASVETSMNNKERNLCSIGKAFSHSEYKVNDKGELLVKSKAMSFKILVGDKVYPTDYSEYFNTKDLAEEINGKVYLCGRVDDLIIDSSGENVNPELLEPKLLSPLASAVCLFADSQNNPTLIVSIEHAYTKESLEEVYKNTFDLIAKNNLSATIKKVLFTTDKFLDGGDFKVSRKKIALKYKENKFDLIDPLSTESKSKELLSKLEKEIISTFATVLGVEDCGILLSSNFFTDLGGNSLQYFTLLDELGEKLGKTIIVKEGVPLLTAQDFCNYFTNEN